MGMKNKPVVPRIEGKGCLDWKRAAWSDVTIPYPN